MVFIIKALQIFHYSCNSSDFCVYSQTLWTHKHFKPNISSSHSLHISILQMLWMLIRTPVTQSRYHMQSRMYVFVALHDEPFWIYISAIIIINLVLSCILSYICPNVPADVLTICISNQLQFCEIKNEIVKDLETDGKRYVLLRQTFNAAKLMDTVLCILV